MYYHLNGEPLRFKGSGLIDYDLERSNLFGVSFWFFSAIVFSVLIRL